MQIKVHLYIQNGTAVYEPVVEGNIVWETQRKGQPGKCSFTLIQDQFLNIQEGNAVRLDVNGTSVFFGFIFERTWNSDGLLKITAYDQLRYLKNKDSYNYTEKTASQVLQMIAADFNLRVGVLEDTGYTLSRNEKDKTLFDIILNALDLTMIYTGKIFVLYDDAGQLVIRNTENMALDVTIAEDTAQDYDYKISIDSDTYNQIKVYCDNDKTKKRDVYMTKSTENINKWGVLQFSESIDKASDGQKIAENYLIRYNKPSRSLSIKEAFGDIRVRAGCYIPVTLDVREEKLNNYLLVEAVTHKIDKGVHTMDLTLRGVDMSG